MQTIGCACKARSSRSEFPFHCATRPDLLDVLFIESDGFDSQDILPNGALKLLLLPYGALMMGGMVWSCATDGGAA